MNLPRRPDRGWNWGNIITTVAAVAALISMTWTTMVRMVSTDAAAATVPQIEQRVGRLEMGQQSLRQDVDMLKQRRVEDAAAVQGMRTEIVQRLERIENKLDQKADKPAHTWAK